MKITPELIEELKTTDSITRKNQIEKLINEKTQKIIVAITKAYNENNYWWSWRWYDEDESQPPFSVYSNIEKESIAYQISDVGDLDYLDKKGGLWDLSQGCPIDWLYDDNFEQDLTEGIQKSKDKEKLEQENSKKLKEKWETLKNQYTQSAKEKLTPEELWATGLSKKIPKSLKHLETLDI